MMDPMLDFLHLTSPDGDKFWVNRHKILAIETGHVDHAGEREIQVTKLILGYTADGQTLGPLCVERPAVILDKIFVDA